MLSYMVTGQSWENALVDGDKVRDLHEIDSFFNTSIVLEDDKVPFRTLSSANFVPEEDTKPDKGTIWEKRSHLRLPYSFWKL